MREFAQTYRGRHFLDERYDLDGGYLQTTLSDDSRMPLRFFVEFAAADPTAAPIERIRHNLQDLLERI